MVSEEGVWLAVSIAESSEPGPVLFVLVTVIASKGVKKELVNKTSAMTIERIFIKRRDHTRLIFISQGENLRLRDCFLLLNPSGDTETLAVTSYMLGAVCV